MARPKPLVLIILDGWGYAPPSKSNAISLARKPTFDKLLREFPNTLIQTSGRAVGLPVGQMGNSEVGHLNIGAGRVVYMDITRLDLMIENGELFKHPLLLEAMKQARVNGRRLHFIGLLSDGGVHSHENHLYALLEMAKQNGVECAFVHAFLDGRDTPPDSGAGYLEKLQQKMREYGIGKIASVCGRYYAMDRDKKWERERKAFDAMVRGKAEGGVTTDPVNAVRESYNRGVNDEFVIPFVCVDEKKEPVGTIRDEDVVINFNFRADRARQITQVLTRESGITALGGCDLPDADRLESEIPARELPKHLHYLCMTEYDLNFKLPTVIPPELMNNILADVMAAQNMRNLRVAETEKYAHVTFFFNGGVEKPFPGEDRGEGAPDAGDHRLPLETVAVGKIGLDGDRTVQRAEDGAERVHPAQDAVVLGEQGKDGLLLPAEDRPAGHVACPAEILGQGAAHESFIVFFSELCYWHVRVPPELIFRN